MYSKTPLSRIPGDLVKLFEITEIRDIQLGHFSAPSVREEEGGGGGEGDGEALYLRSLVYFIANK